MTTPANVSWQVRVVTCARNTVVMCCVACIPFAADLASNARVHALAANHHPNSAISNPAAVPVPLRSEAGTGSQS